MPEAVVLHEASGRIFRIGYQTQQQLHTDVTTGGVRLLVVDAGPEPTIWEQMAGGQPVAIDPSGSTIVPNVAPTQQMYQSFTGHTPAPAPTVIQQQVRGVIQTPQSPASELEDDPLAGMDPGMADAQMAAYMGAGSPTAADQTQEQYLRSLINWELGPSAEEFVGTALAGGVGGGLRMTSLAFGAGSAAFNALRQAMTTRGLLAAGGVGVAAESLTPWDALPGVPSVQDLLGTAGQIFGGAAEFLPGGATPGQGAATQALLQSLAANGVMVRKITHLPQGGWIGSYLPSPSARKLRGFYVSQDRTYIRTWPNRGHLVISNNPRAKTLAKAAGRIDKMTSGLVQAQRTTSKTSSKFKKKAKK